VFFLHLRTIRRKIFFNIGGIISFSVAPSAKFRPKIVGRFLRNYVANSGCQANAAITRRTGAVLRHQKKRGILRSIKDPQYGRFDLWGDCCLDAVGEKSRSR
jgi:hypothetical protein